MPSFLRTPATFAAGAFFTSLVFLLLWVFIHTGESQAFEMTDAKRVEFTRLRRDTETASRRASKAKRDRPDIAPQAPKMNFASSSASTDAVAMLTPEVNARAAMTKMTVNVGGSDRDIMPLVRINPDYPPRAQSRGIEGWVLVQFTITAAGTVRDAKVVDASPRGYFEEAALKAIARWRYNPKVQEGVAVERVGVRVRLSFNMER
ncbi:MAG: TonB family protein [Deltaproteobacteria bacterium]|nr:TonB family protein [Deltaproteobacteria bacterium]